MKERIVRVLRARIRNAFVWAFSTNIMVDDKDFPIGQIQSMGKTQDNVVYAFPVGYSASPPLNTPGLRLNVGDSENAIFIPFSFRDREKGLVEGEVVVRNPITGSLVKFLSDGSIKIDSKNEILVDSVGNVIINAPAINSTANWTNVGDFTNEGAMDNTGALTNTGNVTINGNLQVNGTINGASTITAAGALGGSSISAGGISGSGGTLSATDVSATNDVTAGAISLSSHPHGGVTVGGGLTGGPQ